VLLIVKIVIKTVLMELPVLLAFSATYITELVEIALTNGMLKHTFATPVWIIVKIALMPLLVMNAILSPLPMHILKSITTIKKTEQLKFVLMIARKDGQKPPLKKVSSARNALTNMPQHAILTQQPQLYVNYPDSFTKENVKNAVPLIDQELTLTLMERNVKIANKTALRAQPLEIVKPAKIKMEMTIL